MGLLLLYLIVEDDDLVGCICLAFDLILYILPLILLLYPFREVSRLFELFLGDEFTVFPKELLFISAELGRYAVG